LISSGLLWVYIKPARANKILRQFLLARTEEDMITMAVFVLFLAKSCTLLNPMIDRCPESCSSSIHLISAQIRPFVFAKADSSSHE